MPTTSYSRPEPPEPIEGYVWTPLPSAGWRIHEGRQCRAGATRGKSSCGAPSVAALNRGRVGTNNWWAYCADHMYGRWIEGQQVMQWALREATDV